jgi:hypothetical protein
MSSQITLLRIEYEQLLFAISKRINSTYKTDPISGKYKYWRYKIDKNNKVKIKSLLTGEWKRVNKELKRIENE